MMNEEARADLSAEMDNLSRKKAEVGVKVRELQAASGEAYADLKEGTDRAMVEMEKAYDQAMSRFQK